MSSSYISAQVRDLRARNQQTVLEAILVSVVALMTVALLPSLIVQYFYDVTLLTEEPAVLRYIPVFSYIATAAYFVFAFSANMMRERRIKELLSELAVPAVAHSTHEPAISESELAELEAMVDEVLENSNTKKAAPKKKPVRKSKSAKK